MIISLGIHNFSWLFLFRLHGTNLCNFHSFLKICMLYVVVYHDIKILVIQIIVIIVNKFGSLIIQLDIPIDIKIKENSLIGISVIQVRKLFLFMCHIIFNSHIVMIGLNITTRNNQAAINHRFRFQLNDRFDHRSTK